jgi:hypothetical protein
MASMQLVVAAAEASKVAVEGQLKEMREQLAQSQAANRREVTAAMQSARRDVRVAAPKQREQQQKQGQVAGWGLASNQQASAGSGSKRCNQTPSGWNAHQRQGRAGALDNPSTWCGADAQNDSNGWGWSGSSQGWSDNSGNVRVSWDT